MTKLLVALVVLGSVQFAGADNLRSEIVSMNRTVRSAMMHRDMNAFVRVLKGRTTPDFKYTEAGQTMDFKKMTDLMRMSFAQMVKITAANTTVVSLKEHGNTATGRSIRQMAGITLDPQHKPHKFDISGVTVETYRRVSGKWLMASMTWKSQSMKSDGKPIPAG